MDLLKSKKTQTTYFLLPLLFSEDTKYSQIINNKFVDAYIADYARKQYDDNILLVYSEKPTGIPVSTKIDEYKDEINFILVHTLPRSFIKDYEHFLKGEWSQFSKEAKERILNFWEEDENSFIYGTLYHVPNKKIKAFYKKYTNIESVDNLKKADYWYKPNIVLEVLGI